MPTETCCPHVSRALKFHEQSNLMNAPGLCCLDCNTSVTETCSAWVCLTCSHVGCDQLGHAFSHWSRYKHPLALDLKSGTCHCFRCEGCVSPTTSTDLQILYKYLLSCYNVNQTLTPRKQIFKSSRLNQKRKRVEEESPPSKKRKLPCISPGQIGLQNLGNTCYMNAVLQVLSHTEAMRAFFLSMLDEKAEQFRTSATAVPLLPRITRKRKEESPPVRCVSLVAEMRDIVRDLWFHDAPTFSATTFLTSMWSVMPRFYGTQQHDAHEFLRSLLDQLHMELKSSPLKKERAAIPNVFQGMLLSKLTCQACGSSSQHTDPFLDLSVDVPVSDEVIPLEDCISQFMSEETLDPNPAYCKKCKCEDGAVKQFYLKSAPRVLCLHLKRFRWDSQKRVKITTHLGIPSRMNLSSYSTNRRTSYKYELYGVVSHRGAK